MALAFLFFCLKPAISPFIAIPLNLDRVVSIESSYSSRRDDSCDSDS